MNNKIKTLVGCVIICIVGIAVIIAIMIMQKPENPDAVDGDSTSSTQSVTGGSQSSASNDTGTGSEPATSTSGDSEVTQPNTDSAEPTVELPTLREISVEETPLLYDYVYGSVSWHFDWNLASLAGSPYIVAYNIKDRSHVYVSQYEVAEYWDLPVPGTNPVSVNISEEQYSHIVKAVNDMTEDYRKMEGDWVFALLGIDEYDIAPDGCHVDSDGKWCDIAFYDIDFKEFSPAFKYIQTNGYPIEWCRVPWIKETMERVYSLNLDMQFWDDFNPFQRVYYVDASGIPVSGCYALVLDSNRYVIVSNQMDTEDESTLEDVLIFGYMNGWDTALSSYDDGMSE